jgi:Family of unknown function (DUF5678)
MPSNVLVKDGEKYSGKYVATRSFKDKAAVCSGKDLVDVLNRAKAKGVKDPVVFYVPEKDMVHIY